MKVYIILIFIYGLLFGCGVLQNTSKRTSESLGTHIASTDLSTWMHTDSATDTQVLTFFKDSVNRDYWVQLWPKGRFTFSNDKGFEGEAEKIVMQGNVKGVKTGTGLTTSHNQSSADRRTELKIDEQLKLKDKDMVKKVSPSWFWLIGLAAVIGITLLLIYGRNKI